MNLLIKYNIYTKLLLLSLSHFILIVNSHKLENKNSDLLKWVKNRAGSVLIINSQLNLWNQSKPTVRAIRFDGELVTNTNTVILNTIII